MSRSLIEAAKELGVHPLQVVLALAPLVNRFSDVWPEIEDGFIPTLRQLGLSDTSVVTEQESPGIPEPAPAGNVLRELQLDNLEIGCLRRLSGKKHWGKNSIPEDVLRSKFLRETADPVEALHRLVKADLLVQHGRHRYALNPHKKAEIEAIISGNSSAHSPGSD